MRLLRIVLLPSVLFITFHMQSQCVVINEIMINGPGPNDGSNSPDTEEWIELYNTCDVAADISCFVLTDGDFTVTMPSGTLIQPFSFFTIGSINAGYAVDLNWGTCGCSSGSGIGIFTNGNEQLILSDASGVLVDAIYWGNGQFPLGISSMPLGDCQLLSFNIGAVTSDFEHLPSGGGQGCALARACDGSDLWVELCVPTPQATNSDNAVNVLFESSAQTICSGSCIDFSDLSGIPFSNWSWTFEGSTTAFSSEQNPAGICYPDTGSYNVTLAAITECGSTSVTYPDYIVVTPGESPIVDVSGPLEFCAGDSVVFSSSSPGAYQWYLNGQVISGSISGQYVATESGLYELHTTQNGCVGFSQVFEVNVVTELPVEIFTDENLTICIGDHVQFYTNSTYATYQWYLNDVIIDGATDSTYSADIAGHYTLGVTNGSCAGLSNVLNLFVNATAEVLISPSNDQNLCEGDEATFSANGNYDSYQWLFNGVEVSGANGPDLTVNAEGSYSLQATIGNCAGVSDVVALTFSSPIVPTIDAGPTSTICEGQQLTMTTTTNFDSYQWYLNGAEIVGATNNSLQAIVQGNYSVMVTNGACTSQSDNAFLTVTPTPSVILTPLSPLEICEGETATINANSGFTTYQWMSNAAELPGETTSALTVAQSGNYTVQVTQGNCSALSDVFTVVVNPYPEVTITSPANVISCNGTYTLTCESTGSIQWLWSGNLIDGATQTEYVPTASGTYVVISSIGNCTTTSNFVDVVLLRLYEVTIESSNATPCDGDVVLLTANGTFDSVLWSTGEISPTISVTSSGDYSVESTLSQCTAQDNYVVNFQSFPLVNAGVDITSDCANGVILLGTGEGTLQWSNTSSLDDLGNGVAQVNPDLNTVYTLTATLAGCVSTDQILVTADCGQIEVPNVFSPNGDGLNDVFEIKSRGIATYELKVFDRWGVLMFESNNPKQFWTGRHNGELVSEGTYYWTMIALNERNESMLTGLPDKGNVTVLR